MAQTWQGRILLKRRINSVVLLLLCALLILAAFITINYYKRQVVSQYDGINQTTDNIPLPAKSKGTTAGASSETNANDQTEDLAPRDIAQTPPAPRQVSVNSNTRGATNEAPGAPPQQGTSPPTSPPAQNNPPEEEPDLLLGCILGFCL